MRRLSLLPLACVLSAGCFTQPILASESFQGWETPEVLVKHEPAAQAAVAMAVPDAPVPVPAQPATKQQIRSAFTKGQPGKVTQNIDLDGALTTTASRAQPTTRRATTQRAAVSAPKLERNKQGAVSLSRTKAAPTKGSSSLSIGTSVRRGLSSDQIRDVALSSMGQVRACYERALKTSPSLQGKIVVDWKVAPSGHVTRASVQTDQIGDKGLQACILETVKSWTFPESGRSTPVSFPFTLRPG